MLHIIPPILLLLSTIVFGLARLRLYLHFFQQEEYEGARFIKWIFKKHLFDKRLSAILLVIGLVSPFIFHEYGFIYQILLAGIFVLFAYLQRNPSKRAKKKLVFTKRAARIFIIANICAFCLSVFLIGTNITYFTSLSLVISLIIWVQILPLLLTLANQLLTPLESHIQKKILKEAKKKLAQLHPIIVGITGSYGKTSTKHILAHILSAAFPTLATPGSVNTLMGVSRIIREQLTPAHKVFVVELGAYYPGAIRDKCGLTPPDYGIFTSVGHAHYERFKTVQAVAKTKSELLEAVLSRGGKMVINQAGIDLNLLNQSLLEENRERISYVKLDEVNGPSQEKGLNLANIKQRKDGLYFELSENGKTYSIQAPLYGRHHAFNIASAFALARAMDIPAETIIAAVKTLPQIRHRLEVTQTPANITIIDDAYNSNPIGFKAALELLPILKGENGRKILVTPGMIELGRQHDEKHFELGKFSAAFADIVLLIMPRRQKAFIDGFKQNVADADRKLYYFDTFAEAKEWVDRHIRAGDAILYENDLPDLYESKILL